MAQAAGGRYEDFADRMARAAEREAENVARLLDEIERRRNDAEQEGLNFTAPTEDQLVKKYRSVNSPMIVFQSWSGSVSAGGTLNYTVGIHNPDPDISIWLFAHVFVGPANLAPSVGSALSAVDGRFPRLTEPQFSGLAIDAGQTDSLDFALQVPNSIDSSNYLGNSFLFRATWHDPADYLDRGLFVFAVA